VPSTSRSRWRSADTTSPTHYTDGASVHPVLKTPRPICLCLLSRDRQIDRRFSLTKASVHPVLKNSSWRVSILIKLKRRIDRRYPHSDRRIIWCYCLRCSSSVTRPTLLEIGPSVHPTVPRVFTQCTNSSDDCTDTCYIDTVGSSDGVLPFSFLSFLLNLECGILASLGPRNVYKDMLNNMVSPIDHVVMNHQNQTRTNGI
jgi:hypothetical protein